MRIRSVIVLSFLLHACAEGGDGPAGIDGGDEPAPDAGIDPSEPDGGGTPVDCASCELSFSYPAAGATSVELRGNFAVDGWEIGVPMTQSADQFVATIEVPHGRAIHYKLVID